MSKAAAAVVTAAGLSLTGAAAAANATPAQPQAHASKADVKFLTSNEQVNLTEITLARIVLKDAKGPRARALAHMTLKDHLAARAANKKVAKKDGIVLPTKPDAMQVAGAEELAASHHVALTYFTLQVAGHKVSIKQTRHEIKNGRRHNVLAYAGYYLPVAKHHLEMSKRDLAEYKAGH